MNLETKICTICGKEFEGKTTQKYCSVACSNKAKYESSKDYHRDYYKKYNQKYKDYQKENKKVYLFQTADNGKSSSLASKQIKLLNDLGVIVIDEISDYKDNPDLIFDEKDCRNQALFMKNLANKWLEDVNVKKCYLCGCTIQKAIIASHIQRVADINKLPIEAKEKRQKATDENNGFWLCANHDKMFEYGIITFNEVTGEFILGQDYLNNEILTPEQERFIKEITKKDKIDPKYFTKELQSYLKIHNDRIKEENLKRKI